MPRRYSDRRGWWRLERTRFKSHRLENEYFKGVVTLLCLDRFKEPFYAEYDPAVCIASSGYAWVQHFPDGECYAWRLVASHRGQCAEELLSPASARGLRFRGSRRWRRLNSATSWSQTR